MGKKGGGGGGGGVWLACDLISALSHREVEQCVGKAKAASGLHTTNTQPCFFFSLYTCRSADLTHFTPHMQTNLLTHMLRLS